MLGRDSIWSWFLSSNDGQSIITSSADDQIIIYDCEKGTQKRVLNSKKYWKSSILLIQSITSASNRYGVDLIHFTQNKGHAVHASTKENDIIRSEKNTLFPNGDDKTEDWNEGTLKTEMREPYVQVHVLDGKQVHPLLWRTWQESCHHGYESRWWDFSVWQVVTNECMI